MNKKQTKKTPIAKGKKVSPKKEKPIAVFNITISEYKDGSQNIQAEGKAHAIRLAYALSQVINQVLGEDLSVKVATSKTKMS